MSLIKKIFKSRKNKTLNTSYTESDLISPVIQNSDEIKYENPIYQDEDNSITFLSSKTADNYVSQINEDTLANQVKADTNIIEQQEKNQKKAILAKITPKKMAFKKDDLILKSGKTSDDSLSKKHISQLTRKEYEEKIDGVLESISHLLAPFKDILIKNVPIFTYPVLFVEKSGLAIIFIAKKIFLNIPIAVRFIKSKIFKITISLVFILFMLGIMLSKMLSTPEYKRILESNIYNATGYEAEIKGNLVISLIPYLSIGLNSVFFYTSNDSPMNSFGISQVSSEKLYIRIKLLPLLQGNIVVSEINLNKFSLNVKASSVGIPSVVQQYDIMINDIANNLNSSNFSKLDFNSPSMQSPNLGNLDNKMDDTSLESQSKSMERYTKNQSYVQVNSFDRAVSYFINKIQLDLNKINALNLTQGKINFLNQNNQRAISLDNINSSLSKSGNNLKIVGSTLLNLINTDYIINLEGINNNMVGINAQIIFDYNDDAIRIKGKMDSSNHIFSGDINSQYSILYLINKFVYPTNTKLINTQFNSKFTLTPTYLLINDYNLQIGNDTINGNFLWNYGINNYIKLDIMASINNLNPILNQIMTKSIEGNTQLLSGLSKEISLLRNDQINLFKPNYYDLNIVLNNSYLNNVKINNITLNAILTNDKLIYINSFELAHDNNYLKILGRLNLENADTKLLIQSKGDIVSSLKVYGISPQAQDLVDLINTSKDYSLNAILLFDDSKNYIAFNDINGFFGNMSIQNANFTMRYFDTTLISTLNLSLDTLDINKVEKIYKTYVANSNFDTAFNTNLFGLKDNDLFNLNLSSKKVIYNDYSLSNGVLDLQFNQLGFKIDKFMVNDDEGGYISAIATINTAVSPQIFGSFNFNNLSIDVSNLKGLMFSNKKLSGSFLVNGGLRFSNDNLSQILNNLNGSITLIKKERIKFNRFAENSTLYLTINETFDKKNNAQYLLSDISGQLNIVNNVISIESVGMRYFKNNLEYRGTFYGTYNVITQILNLNGAMDNALDTSKRIEFSANGSILAPLFTTKSIVLKDRVIQQQKEQVKIKQLSTDLDDNSYYAKSRSATNFRNPYRSEDKESQETRNRIYNDVINQAPEIIDEELEE